MDNIRSSVAVEITHQRRDREALVDDACLITDRGEFAIFSLEQQPPGQAQGGYFVGREV